MRSHNTHIRNKISATELPTLFGGYIHNIPGLHMKIIDAIAADRMLCWAVATALVILMFKLVL